LKESLWAQLQVQSLLSSLFSLVNVTTDPDTGSVTYDLSGLTSALQQEATTNYAQATQDIANSYRAIIDLGMDQNSNFASFYSAFSSDPTLKTAMDTAGKTVLPNGTYFDTSDPIWL